MQAQLNAVLERHCATIKSDVATLGRMLEEIASSSAAYRQQVLEEAEGLAHQLKGSSGTAGFRDIIKAATALDGHLKVFCHRGDDQLAAQMNKTICLYQSLVPRITDPRNMV